MFSILMCDNGVFFSRLKPAGFENYNYTGMCGKAGEKWSAGFQAQMNTANSHNSCELDVIIMVIHNSDTWTNLFYPLTSVQPIQSGA